MCQELKNEGVVGIDIAGDEGAIRNSGDSEVFTDFDKEIFRKAKNLGIHRTVHAGEDGPSVNVKVAVEEMFAERIGMLNLEIRSGPEKFQKVQAKKTREIK